MHKNQTLDMEFHHQELQRHCRVCGKRLCKAKSKATVYPCTRHQDSLLKSFGIDVSQGESTIHLSNSVIPAMLSADDGQKPLLMVYTTPTVFVTTHREYLSGKECCSIFF